MTRLKMKLKSQSKKPLKGKKRQTKLPKEEVNLPQKLRRKLEGNQHIKNSKSGKKPPECSSKTISTEEKVNSEPKVPKMVTRSSSRLKLVPEKLMNYFTEQDDEYFSNEEADDVFVSGKFRKK